LLKADQYIQSTQLNQMNNFIERASSHFLWRWFYAV